MKNLLETARRMGRFALPHWLLYTLRARETGVQALMNQDLGLSLSQTRELFGKFQRATEGIRCGHAEQEMIKVVRAIIKTPAEVPGVILEAGCFNGGSTAKFSLAAAAAGRQLVVFDSFQGIPANDEGFTRNISGATVAFREGDYACAEDQVRQNVERYGDVSVTRFVPGWLEDTLPHLEEPVAVAYIDVDLISSTLTCLKYIWPLLPKGGILFSQDGHLTNVLEAISDDDWWQRELGQKAPTIFGFGVDTLVYMVK